MTENPFAHCRQIARRSGSSFLLPFRLLEAPRREALTALYAFCRVVDDVVDEAEHAPTAREQLQEWRAEIDRVYGGTPATLVGAALAQVCPRYALPQQHFLEILDGMAMDLPPPRRFADREALENYCYHVASAVGLLAARIFGSVNDAVLRYARLLGIALQRINILRDVGEDWQRGRLYLPQDAMAAHGVTEADLTAPAPSPALRALLQSEAARARSLYDEALAALPPENRAAQRPGLMMGALYRTLLDKIAAQDFAVLHQRVRLSVPQKLAVAARTLIA